MPHHDWKPLFAACLLAAIAAWHEAGADELFSRPIPNHSMSEVTAEEGGSVAADADNSFESEPLNSGYVIWDGHYIAPPYSITKRGDQVFLNERSLPRSTPLVRPMGHGRRGPRGNSPSFAEIVQHTLERNGLLLVESDNTHLIRDDGAPLVLQALLSDSDRAAKVADLTQAGLNGAGFSPRVQWAAVVDSFVPDEGLRDRFKRESVVVDSATSDNQSPVSLSKRTVRYGMTVTGMILGVLAFGMLLQHQPHVRGARGEVDNQGEGFQLLPRYVLLVLLFAVFDLACTLFASEAGGLLELNPIGSTTMHDPFAVGGLKILATLGSAGILLTLRQYRLAQVASWWLCLVCVFLTLRWVTFNSMFLA